MHKQDQTLVNQMFEFPPSPQVTMSLQTNSQRHCPTLYPKENSVEEGGSRQEQMYEIS